MKIRWLGNSCLEVILSDINYLIDPNFIVEPKESPDQVLLSHEHDDHFDVEKFNGLGDSISLYAPEASLNKFDVDGTIIKPGDTVDSVKVLDCDCYGAEESVCFKIDNLYHTADSADFPVIEGIDILFSACFQDNYDDYFERAKEMDPEVVIPYHYNPEEEFDLAKGLKDRLLENDINSKILEIGEIVETDF